MSRVWESYGGRDEEGEEGTWTLLGSEWGTADGSMRSYTVRASDFEQKRWWDDPKIKDALAAASRAVFSGAASVLRPASLARDVRTVGGDWRDDWLLVRVRGFAQCPNQISAHGQHGRVVVEK